MNRNILFVLGIFLLLLGALQIREGFREGQLSLGNPPPTKKQKDSCKLAKKFWDKRKENLMFMTMAVKFGAPCMLKNCGGNPKNDWKCQEPPKTPTEKQKNSCKLARKFWAQRNSGIRTKALAMQTMALNVGKPCMESPCKGNTANNWTCVGSPPPPPPKKNKPTEAQKNSCKLAKTFWAKRNENMIFTKMALKTGLLCSLAPCKGNASNNFTCVGSPPPPPPPPTKSTAGQRKSCKAAKILWDKRNMKGKLGLAMRTKAMQMGIACNMKPCSGGPANDWKCQDEPVKEGFTLACSDKELEEITRLENRLKAAKKRCSNNSASGPMENFRIMREGFREGQTAAQKAAEARQVERQRQALRAAASRARASQAAAARRQQAQAAARARAAAAQQAAAAAAARRARAVAAENNRRARFRSRELRLDTDARRAPKASPEQLKSCAVAAAACATNCTMLRQGEIARGVGRPCTAPPCYGGPQNNWKCITSLDNLMRVKGPTAAQQNSCTAAKGFFAKRNENVAMLARAMNVGKACNSCGGNTTNNFTCTSTRQAAAAVAKRGATGPSSAAAVAAGASPAVPRCTKCDAFTIARNLGDQYKNNPNICKTRKDEAQCADAGGLWNDEVAANPKKDDQGVGGWKVEIDEKTGDLVFNHKGQTKSKLTKTGEWSSDSRKCGTWNIRKDRIGIPGRGDIHLHTDGWQRAFKYDAPYGGTAYNKGGFAGRELWYGGSVGGKLTK